MARPKKETKAVTIRLPISLIERLEGFCEQSGQTKTIAVERSIGMYIDDYEEKQQLISREIKE